MKVGDRLYCKKSLVVYISDIEMFKGNCEEYFTEGLYYTIRLSYTIGYKDNVDEGMVNISGNGDSGLSFICCKHNEDYHRYVYDYFYTEKELRKMKLKKLNNVDTK